MRNFLLTIFWLLNIGSVVQLAVIVSALWAVYSGLYSFSSLDVSAFVTEMIPRLTWLKDFLVSILGDLGHWVLALPILFVAPMKLLGDTLIGVWIYTAARNMPAESASE